MVGFDLYIAYLNDELSAEEKAKAKAMLAVSDEARRDFAAAQEFLAAGKSPAPRSSLLQAVKDRFRREKERGQLIIQEMAQLDFDSWSDQALTVRNGPLLVPDERQMLFSSGSVDLDLQLAKDTDAPTQTLHGQLLTDDDALSGIELRLQGRDMSSRRVVTDELGRFRFSHIETGHYDLQVRLADRDLKLDIEA